MRAALIAGLVFAAPLLNAGVALAQQPPPAGYPPAQQPPPAGYPPDQGQQPPPGYPPNQYPPAQQQPGYPPAQQPGYPPAQQQGYPPAQYQQPYAAPPPPPPKRGLLFLPYFGVETHRGSTGRGLGPGVALGALLGVRLGPQLSINGELSLDIMNPKNAGSDVTDVEGDLTVSPLFHAPMPAGEIVIGPKFGLFGASQDSSGGKVTVSGLAVGINAGAFFAVSPQLSVGGLISFTVRDATEVCTAVGTLPEFCDSDTDFTSEKVLAFQGGLLF